MIERISHVSIWVGYRTRHRRVLGFPGRNQRYSTPPAHAPSMPKISVEVPEELLEDLDRHVGEDGKFVNRSEAIRASIRKTLDLLDEIDERHGRIDDEE